MPLKIAQSASQAGERRWKWSVWIEGPDSELDEIQEVTWKLHPTFREPIRRTAERATKFKLDTSGWGEFTVYATLKMKNGRIKSRQHWLKLTDSEQPLQATSKTAATVKKGAQPSVFLSSSLNNANLAAHLAQELEKNAYKVVRDIDVPIGADLRDWNREQIGQANAVIMLGADESSVIRSSEVKIAQANGVKVISVTLGRSPTKKAPGDLLGNIQSLNVALGAPTKVAPTIANMIDKLLKTL